MEKVKHSDIYESVRGRAVFTGLFDAGSADQADLSTSKKSYQQPNGPGQLRRATPEEVVDLGQEAAIRLHKMMSEPEE